MRKEKRVEEEEKVFPVGMRVLAVDDNPICLKLLHNLLLKCRYHVTTTSQAVEALRLLRENKDNFDLVISDVHMPDMDGFKLLELVGLEMNLPVIMLSANGDTKLVMKGITHGACDYLLKPVRMEELKNIWQHVVRRKKKVYDNGNYKSAYENEALPITGVSDQNIKLNRKRKDQKEEDEDRENAIPDEDSSTQKKARLVWTGDLHRKFVAVVRTLGIDNAFPKKILEMMNMENLTRENVASHLQKYRKYLKRISCVTSQQANMVAALGSPDSAYLRMTSFNGNGNLPNDASRPYSSTGLFSSRLNTPSGLPMPSLPLSGTIQLANARNLNNPINIQNNIQPVMNPQNQNGNIQSEPISIHVNRINTELFPSDLPGFGRCTDSSSACQPNPFREDLKTGIPSDYGNVFPNTVNVNSFSVPVYETSELRADFINNFSAYQSPNTICNSMNLMVSSNGVLSSMTQYNNNFDNQSSRFSRSDLDVIEMQSLSDQQITGQPNLLEGPSYHNGGSLEDIVSRMRKLDQEMFM